MSTATLDEDADGGHETIRCNASIADFGLRACRECKREFQAIRVNQHFCSNRCRFAHWDRLHPRPKAPLLAMAEAAERESYLAPLPLPEEPGARRDVRKAIAASNNRWQRTVARWATLMCFGADEYVYTDAREASIASDVRAWCGARGIALEWSKPWTGSLFDRCEWFEPTGAWRNARHAGGHARKVMEWRLTDEGRAAYRAAREAMG